MLIAAPSTLFRLLGTPRAHTTLNRSIDRLQRDADKAIARGDVSAAHTLLRSIGNTERHALQHNDNGELSDRRLLKLTSRLEGMRTTLAGFDPLNQCNDIPLAARPAFVTQLQGVSVKELQPRRHWADSVQASVLCSIPRAWSSSSESSSPTKDCSDSDAVRTRSSPHSFGSFSSFSSDESYAPLDHADRASSLSNCIADINSQHGDSMHEPAVSERSEAVHDLPPSEPASPLLPAAADVHLAAADMPEQSTHDQSSSALPRLRDGVHMGPPPRFAFARRILDRLAEWLRKALGREPTGGLRRNQRIYLGSNRLPNDADVLARRDDLFNDFWAGFYNARALARAVEVSAENALLVQGSMVVPEKSLALQRELVAWAQRNTPQEAAAPQKWILDVLMARLNGSAPSPHALAEAYWAGEFVDTWDLRQAVIEHVRLTQPALDPAADARSTLAFANGALELMSAIRQTASARPADSEAVVQLHAVRDQLEQEIAESIVFGPRFGVDDDPLPPRPGDALQLFELPDGRHIRV